MSVRQTVEILEALVGFDTTSRNSNLELLAWVENYLDRFGVAHERVFDATGAKANLWSTIGPAAVPGYILSGHTDVVPVDGQDWSHDPFHLAERDGRLYLYDVNALSNFVADPVRVVGFDPTERLVDALVARAGLEEAEEPAAAAGGRRR